MLCHVHQCQVRSAVLWSTHSCWLRLSAVVIQCTSDVVWWFILAFHQCFCIQTLLTFAKRDEPCKAVGGRGYASFYKLVVTLHNSEVFYIVDCSSQPSHILSTTTTCADPQLVYLWVTSKSWAHNTICHPIVMPSCRTCSYSKVKSRQNTLK